MHAERLISTTEMDLSRSSQRSRSVDGTYWRAGLMMGDPVAEFTLCSLDNRRGPGRHDRPLRKVRSVLSVCMFSHPQI